MQTVSLTAHYNGQYIVLDEPYELVANTPLLITVLPQPEAEREWELVARQGLARAYGDDEPEYNTDDLKTTNPDYAGS